MFDIKGQLHLLRCLLELELERRSLDTSVISMYVRALDQ